MVESCVCGLQTWRLRTVPGSAAQPEGLYSRQLWAVCWAAGAPRHSAISQSAKFSLDIQCLTLSCR